MYPETTKLVSAMGAKEIRNNYILYIGAGRWRPAALSPAVRFHILFAFAGGLEAKAALSWASRRARSKIFQ